MIRKNKNTDLEKAGFLTLNRQFCITVTLGIFFSYLALILFLILFEPLINKVNPWLNRVNDSLSSIGRELYQISENPSWSIGNGKKIPEIDAVLAKYPDYRFSYEVYPGIDKKTFEVNGMQGNSKVIAESYTSIILEARDGVAVIGVNDPELVRFGLLVNVAVILAFLAALLLFVGFFVSRKVRYLKNITRNLEYIAGGDLNIKIPVKGRDEISQVAWYVNKMTAALRLQMQKENEAEETKKQLITNISHDLRTPLTAIVGFLGILNNMEIGEDPSRAKQYIRTAYEKSDGLSHLVDQLFQYVLLSNQQTVFTFSEVEASVYFIQAFSELENLMEEKNITIEYSLKSSSHKVRIDCSRMKRVVENLVQNIRKFAKDNSKVTIEGTDSEDRYVVTVTNETAIPLEDTGFLNRYFTTDRTFGKSAGLGLAICKELVEQQQGEFAIHTGQYLFRTVLSLPHVSS